MPSRGEIWLVELHPVQGHEQAGTRPCLVVSVDSFNSSPAQLAVVLPLTSRQRNIPLHVEILPPEGGVVVPSYIMCEGVRCVSQNRFQERWGSVTPQTMAQVEHRLKRLLGLKS